MTAKVLRIPYSIFEKILRAKKVEFPYDDEQRIIVYYDVRNKEEIKVDREVREYLEQIVRALAIERAMEELKNCAEKEGRNKEELVVLVDREDSVVLEIQDRLALYRIFFYRDRNENDRFTAELRGRVYRIGYRDYDMLY